MLRWKARTRGNPARPGEAAGSHRSEKEVYVFACDHPDARNAAITIMVEQTPAGERIRRPGIRRATRH
jgi:hypothetical protein